MNPPRIAALDGLRGFAILFVLFHHFMPYRATASIGGKLANGVGGMGWSGVDLFFVLSGFLITGILWEAKGTTGYLKNFYARRALRIFPLYYISVLLCTVVFPRLHLFPEAVPASSSGWWLLYLQNFCYAFRHGQSQGWLNPLWSLAVEEHFYLVWPAIILYCDQARAKKACLALIAAAPLFRIAFILAGNRWAPYVLTPCRMDSLAMGSFIAVAGQCRGAMNKLVSPAILVLLVAGALAVGICTWRHAVIWDPIVQMTAMPLFSLFYAAILVLVVAPDGWSPFRRLLEMSLLRTFGKYSYGIYIFHSAVAAIAAKLGLLSIDPFPYRFGRLNDLLDAVILTAVSLGVAMMSWFLFETRFMSLKRKFEYRSSPKAEAVETMVVAVPA